MRLVAIVLLILTFTINPITTDTAFAEGTKYNSSASSDTASSGSKERKILYWQAPMNPSYKMDKPGKSPMGMDLVPIYADADEGNGKKGKKGKRTVIKISPEIIQNIGVRTEKAEAARFGTEVRSYGLVTENIRLQDDISSRVSGWVEELKITAVGDEVKKGDLLFTLYSPDLISAGQDYIAALETGIEGRIFSSEKRLKSLGVQDKALEQIKKDLDKLSNLPFYSEVDGIVSQLNIRRGTFVKSGVQIAQIQDYSTVWINVFIAEKDLVFLSKDMKAEVIFPNLSNKVLTARIDYIYPTIDKKSRTGQIRLVLDNPDGVLRPGAYADVNFETNSIRHLAVPSEAVLRSSDGDHVILALGKGRFQAQNVKTGVYNKGRVQILSGLKEGDKVVVSSQFLIDSESSLRESFRKMQKMQKKLSSLKVNKDQLVMIDHLIDASIYIQESLVDGYDLNPKMLMPALKLNDHLILNFRGTKLQFILEGTEKAIMEAKESITDSESRAALADLINSLKPWLLEGKPKYYKDKGLKLFMDQDSGNMWLQLDDEPGNPYGEGHAMLKSWSGTTSGDNNAGK